MNASSQDLKDILVAQVGLGLVFATNLFVGKEPDSPDNCVTIFDTPGSPTLLTLEGDSGGLIYFPSVQIRVRNNDYQVGWALAQDIHEVLHGLNGETWNSTLYSVIRSSSGSPFLLDWDEKDRARFVCTYDIIRR